MDIGYPCSAGGDPLRHIERSIDRAFHRALNQMGGFDLDLLPQVGGGQGRRHGARKGRQQGQHGNRSPAKEKKAAGETEEGAPEADFEADIILAPFVPAITAANAHPVDVIERKDKYEIHADAPGFTPDDISVEVNEGVLTISGVSKEVKEEKGQVVRRERSERRFTRAFLLPENAALESIIANLEHGVLTVTVPKVPEPPKPEPLRIAVGGGGNAGKRQAVQATTTDKAGAETAPATGKADVAGGATVGSGGGMGLEAGGTGGAGESSVFKALADEVERVMLDEGYVLTSPDGNRLVCCGAVAEAGGYC